MRDARDKSPRLKTHSKYSSVSILGVSAIYVAGRLLRLVAVSRPRKRDIYRPLPCNGSFVYAGVLDDVT